MKKSSCKIWYIYRKVVPLHRKPKTITKNPAATDNSGKEKMKYAVVYYPNGNESKYVGSISDYQDGGVADPVLMSKSEAEELMADLTEYVKNEYIGKNDADNEQAHYAFEQGQWGFNIDEFDLDEEQESEDTAFLLN